MFLYEQEREAMILAGSPIKKIRELTERPDCPRPLHFSHWAP